LRCMRSLFKNFRCNLGIDLGTANTLIYSDTAGPDGLGGIILNEPSIVAAEYQDGQLVPYKFGREAKVMIGKTPAKIQAIRPLRDGVIADFRITEAMIRHFIDVATQVYFFMRLTIIICVPSTSTSVERRAIQDAAEGAGARAVYLIEEPIAAALGSGLNIQSANASMIVDIGGGTTEIAVISLGGIVYGHSLRVGGDAMNEAIIHYIRRHHNMLIGEQTAEKIKHEIGSAKNLNTPDHEMSMTIKGRDLVNGIPSEIRIKESDIVTALEAPVSKIMEAIKVALESTPPEIASDIVESGIMLTGGGALLRGFDQVVKEHTGLHTAIANNPLDCVVLGIGCVFKDFPTYSHCVFREE
jgi:rod shape-determining protein MreB